MEAIEQGGSTTAVAVRPGKYSILSVTQSWPTSRKISTGVILAISLALFAVLIIQARNADQQLLYANLPMDDASAVTAWLKNQKIDYAIKNNGKDIWVSAATIYQARLDLAANGLPSGGGVGFEVFDKQSFALTDYVQKVNYTRALQGELARTISSLAPVENTRVHLALPEKRLFKNQQQSGTASVIVTLVPGRSLDQKQVQGIIHLVAGSVSDLEPENVKVIDANGVVLDSEKQASNEQILSADMLAFQREVEHRLELRVQDLLDKTIGRDRAMVRISATLDFAKVEKTEELFDADEPVVRSEQINQESSGQPTAGGIPGVEANLQGAPLAQGAATNGSTRSSRITNYEISKTISRVVNPVGNITQLSVSVVVADRVAPEVAEGEAATAAPRSTEELAGIETMVAKAIGLLPERGDMISVVSMPFVDPEEVLLAGETGSAAPLYHYLPLLKYGLITLAILFIYFSLLRPVVKTMKGEIQQHFKTVQQLEREERRARLTEPEEPPQPVDEAITSLRREVQQNQVPTAFILKNWIQEG
jgi:flagellar M-ring protein FliF